MLSLARVKAHIYQVASSFMYFLRLFYFQREIRNQSLHNVFIRAVMCIGGSLSLAKRSFETFLRG